MNLEEVTYSNVQVGDILWVQTDASRAAKCKGEQLKVISKELLGNQTPESCVKLTFDDKMNQYFGWPERTLNRVIE